MFSLFHIALFPIIVISLVCSVGGVMHSLLDYKVCSNLGRDSCETYINEDLIEALLLNFMHLS